MPSSLVKPVRAPDPAWTPAPTSFSRAAVFYDRWSDTQLVAIAERMQRLVWMLLTNDHDYVHDLRVQLEHAVRAFAASFRDRGVVAEKMIIALKVATAMRRWRMMQFVASEPLHDDIVLWSVREYFRCEDPVDPARRETRYGSMTQR